MAIGSGGEIGATFERWGDMDEASRAAWHAYIKRVWGPDLLGGYGTLCEPDAELRRIYSEITWVPVV